jgi:hypothetical protein
MKVLLATGRLCRNLEHLLQTLLLPMSRCSVLWLILANTDRWRLSSLYIGPNSVCCKYKLLKMWSAIRAQGASLILSYILTDSVGLMSGQIVLMKKIFLIEIPVKFQVHCC